MTLLVDTVCLSVVPEFEHPPLIRRMSSSSGLTSEAQLRYIVQWFREFSELQREDFLPILAAARGNQPDLLAATLASMSCQDKPVSLFQCRIKLFNEWYPSWAEEERDRLLKDVSDIDPEFGNKLQEILTNGFPMNGDINGFGSSDSTLESKEDQIQTNGEPEVLNEQNVEEVAVAQDNLPVEIAAAS